MGTDCQPLSGCQAASGRGVGASKLVIWAGNGRSCEPPNGTGTMPPIGVGVEVAMPIGDCGTLAAGVAGAGSGGLGVAAAPTTGTGPGRLPGIRSGSTGFMDSPATLAGMLQDSVGAVVARTTAISRRASAGLMATSWLRSKDGDITGCQSCRS